MKSRYRLSIVLGLILILAVAGCGIFIVDIRNGDFEDGSDGYWVESPAGRIVSGGFPGGVTPHGGSYLAWLGAGGAGNDSIEQTFTVRANRPYLTLYLWKLSSDSPTWDFGYININGTDVDSFDLSYDTSGWSLYTMDLSAYIGQSITLRFWAHNDGLFDSYFLIDDVAMVAGP